jgi:hypothetical protein
MNTSNTGKYRFLASVPGLRAESLLGEWANISTAYPTRRELDSVAHKFSAAEDAAISKFRDASARLIKRYPDIFSSLPYPLEPPPRAKWKIHPINWRILAKIQRLLCLAWDSHGLREREWYIFQARQEHYFSTVYYPLRDARVSAAVSAGADADQEFVRTTAEEDGVRISPPALTPFEQVIYHFQRIAERASRCGNPECPAPYFFATKKGQKYCSSKCSGPAQREQKRDWWRRNRAKAER